MKINIKCKPGDKVYFVLRYRQGEIIPITCEHILIGKNKTEYYFKEFINSYNDDDFDDLIYTGYSYAHDALKDYRENL